VRDREEVLVFLKFLNWVKGWDRKLILADMIAFSVYCVWTGGISVIFEILYSDATTWQWAKTRVVYFVLKVGLSTSYLPRLTFFLRKVLRSNSKHWLQQGLADSLSVPLYQQSLYIPSALIVGASFAATVSAASLYFADGMLTGWVYGLLLNWCRKKIAGVNNNAKT